MAALAAPLAADKRAENIHGSGSSSKRLQRNVVRQQPLGVELLRPTVSCRTSTARRRNTMAEPRLGGESSLGRRPCSPACQGTKTLEQKPKLQKSKNKPPGSGSKKKSSNRKCPQTAVGSALGTGSQGQWCLGTGFWTTLTQTGPGLGPGPSELVPQTAHLHLAL
ncbi:uncharacterized protein V6R79_019318 [Siganus canaliculatus]